MQQALTSEGSIIQKYPSDYALYKVSEWDDESGMIQNQDRQQVIELDQLIAKENTDGWYIRWCWNFTLNDTLDPWHLAIDFGSLPVLNASFIEENPPIDRAVAVPTQPDFLFDSFFDLKCSRPLPTYSVPGLIDHF